ncbi:hypothetical protein FRC07_005111 [Ceratobasidium sp. 392]|nr:hypothetical protein FRC07_005111 [Ceratobasidium sp. 392]
MLGDGYQTDEDQWRGYFEDALNRVEFHNRNHVYSTVERIIALATSAAMPLCRFGYSPTGGKHGVISTTPDIVTSILEKHFQEDGIVLSASILRELAESSAHYLIARWPREEDHDQHCLLPVLLARLFVTSYRSAPDTARAAAITHTAGAFASFTYPGGDEPTLDDNAHEKRAVRVLRYYQNYNANHYDTMQLFTFGYFSWLPWFMSRGHDTQLAAITRHLETIAGSNGFGQYLWEDDIRSIPTPFFSKHHAVKSVSECISSANGDANGCINNVLRSFLLLGWGSKGGVVDYGFILIALIALFLTDSKEDHEFRDVLVQLYGILLSRNTPTACLASVHFGLLVAQVISDEEDSVAARQLALRPLLNLRDRCSGLTDASPINLNDLISLLKESITKQCTSNITQRIMQSVVDFCDAGLTSGKQDEFGGHSGHQDPIY